MALRNKTSTRFSPTVVDGTVYIGSYDRILYAVNAESGEEVWNFEGDHVRSSPTIADGTVYIGFGDDLRALDAESGDEVWSFETGGLKSSPTVADGIVYTGNWSNTNFYALDASSGEEVWRLKADRPVGSSQRWSTTPST